MRWVQAPLVTIENPRLGIRIQVSIPDPQHCENLATHSLSKIKKREHTYHAVVLGADEEGGLAAGLPHLVPVQGHLLHEPLLEPDQPLLGHGAGHQAVARADQAALHLQQGTLGVAR